MKNKLIITIIILIIAVVLLLVFGISKSNTPSDASGYGVTSDIDDQAIDTMDSQDFTITITTTDNQATITTPMGDIVLELFAEQTPKTVENFTTLARDGFYDDTRFHRVIEGFMIQGGDPLSKDVEAKDMWGTGGPGYQFEDEFIDGLSNVAGTIAMANAGPGTNGSQFFINVADNTFLDGKHTVFGKVTSGYEVVELISQLPTDARDRIQ